ncbi:FAD-dependent oxidoreductase [Streptomyces sp. WAC05950]|uniref:FAD-dependent oxidoreductase n=1 Tax=Streptomyces sp. WAC05950 TaxID=2487419 RepID=UPI0011E4CE61|nr:FAD-dependent oxidoreductase [Streptomyces sp. WAC05950]
MSASASRTSPAPRPSRRAVLAATGAGVLAAGVLPSGAARADGVQAGPQLGEYDVVVVGSGAAGMTAALTAAKRGLSVLVVEKAPTFGGSAARSGAGIWLPNNSVILAAGVPDTPQKAATYLSAVVGPEVPADRQAAFLANGPRMLDFVMANSPLRFRFMEGYSDYYPNLPGGLPNGRSIEPDQIDGNILGGELARLNPAYMPVPAGMVVFSQDYKWLNLAAVSARGLAVSTECLARGTKAALRGEKPLTMGQALAAGLRAGLQRAGAALALMEDAWWGPSIPLPGEPYFCLAERTLPGGLIVNANGTRFVNEAAPYSDVVHVMYEKDRGAVGSHIPAWLIVDQNYRNKYLFKDILPTLPFPESWYQAGAAKKAWTWDALAGQIGVPAGALRATLGRFNAQAWSGTDSDFHRGDTAYDHYYTDPNVLPNSCLAPVWVPPFYAFKIVPGDLGTKGGIVTDARARALRADGSVIRGLYAAGNASAAVMGHSYAGAGSTIGPAMTFGYVAANDIADA